MSNTDQADRVVTRAPLPAPLPAAEAAPTAAASLLPAPGRARLEDSLAAARAWLLARQQHEGCWCGQLEGDTTCESYIVLLEAFLARDAGGLAPAVAGKVAALARVIRARALPAGGWSQYPGGPADLSVSCLGYLALKVAGDEAEAPHMRRARVVIRALGGAGRANSYTRFHFALFGQLPWAEVPAIPPEMLLLPAFAPFSVYDMSSWSRTIFVPLSVLWARKPVVALPPGRGAGELLLDEGEDEDRDDDEEEDGDGDGWRRLFLRVDRVLKRVERLPGAGLVRRVALRRARAWTLARLADSDGLGAILPAMTSSVMALSALGYEQDHPILAENLRHLDGLGVDDGAGGLRVQPCLSPVWDTVLSAHALLQAGLTGEHPAIARAAAWLMRKQCRKPGDWARRNPAAPGGWYFEHRNELYPDVDDTCMALMVLRQAGPSVPEDVLARGLAWMLGMQNRNGGWASFDRDNDKRWLTEIPFADHNAMIDPSTADITGRVLECLSHFPGYGPDHPVVARAVRFLRGDQRPEGAWYGRWGVNYIYGTWQVLRGLRCIGVWMDTPYVQRAARWLLDHQNADGGWGESIASYDDSRLQGRGASTPSQTAWAVMGLIAAFQGGSAAVRRGVRHLLDTQTGDGTWAQEPWTGTGFPRVFYLNYPYYRHHFPLMALAQYQATAAGRPAVT
jgi:squalene-hopene/tetraprenyl-beta-curcumene cyclase